jgi:SAM-dependent methyltransferase
MGDQRYTLDNTDAERNRLARQAGKLQALTTRLFESAGIGAGARVLDVGCGAGDVSALVAELVGDTGSVLGIDRDSAQVDGSSRRFASLPNLSFEVGDLENPPSGPFDAVVGRLVLQYQPDMVEALKALASTLTPSGVLAFVEMSFGGDGSPPPMWPPIGPLSGRIATLIGRAFASTGVHPLVGLQLPSLMRAAGLDPQSPYESGSLLYEGREAAEMQAGLFRSMVPVLETRGEDLSGIDLDALADQLEAEQEVPRIVAVGPIIGVWARPN